LSPSRGPPVRSIKKEKKKKRNRLEGGEQPQVRDVTHKSAAPGRVTGRQKKTTALRSPARKGIKQHQGERKSDRKEKNA